LLRFALFELVLLECYALIALLRLRRLELASSRAAARSRR
jgi:hypothetical protein